MKRWKIPALFVLFIGVLLITCFALFLHRGTERNKERHEDLPIHPISGTNNSSKRHLYTISNPHHPSHRDHEGIDQDSATTHRQNYRRRFSDAIKGVFTDILGTKNNATEAAGDEHSKENNSSRLKRQLELGSTSQSTEDADDDDEFEIKRTTTTTTTSSPPTIPTQAVFTSTRKIYSTRRPFMKILKIKNANTKKPILLTPGQRRLDINEDEVAYSPDISTSPFATSSEEGKRGSVSRHNNANDLKRRVNAIQRRFRVPVRSNGHYPSTINKRKSKEDDKKQDEEEENDHDDDDDHDHSHSHERGDYPKNPKNFTLEVVQVERKVVRKEDGHIPPAFVKGNFNIEPKLTPSKKNSAERKYKKYQETPTNRRSFISVENSNEKPINSAESSSVEEKRKPRQRSREKTSLELENENNGSEDDGKEKSVVVDLNKQVPHDDRDLTDEDLKDYTDGHSTFGSKGNFQHTIISRNVSGFLPNGGGDETGDSDSHEGLRKRSGNGSGERKIVIEKGKVTEKYPENEENENPEIFSVPGGRRASKEDNNEEVEVVPFSKLENKKEQRPRPKSDLTSPAIQTSLDELYRKGHPGVVPAPPVLDGPSHKRHPFSEPYEESEDYGSPFKYNPIEDEPPLKFDPASDRFYGSPQPDSKEKLGQSNSPVPVENRESEQDLPQEDYFPQVKPQATRKPAIFIPENSDSEDVGEQSQSQGTDEDDQSQAPPQPRPQAPRKNQGFEYGRVYNPPDPDYDQEDYANIQANGDRADADFQAALEDNFNTDDEFFEFPGEDGGTVREVRRKFNSKPDNEVVRIDDNDNDYEQSPKPKQNSRPRPSLKNTEDYEVEQQPPYTFGTAVQRAREGDGTRRSSRVDEEREHDDAPEVYDSGFIQTLKQFDEEIKKLQEQERRKLLQSHPIPELQRTTPLNHPQSNSPKDVPVVSLSTGGRNQELGYKKQGPPLVISSPGPLQEPPLEDYQSPAPPSEGGGGDDASEDEVEVNDQQEVPPTEEEVEDDSAVTLSAKERNDEDSEETVPVSVRSMEEVVSSFQPLFKKRSTDGLKENVEVIK